MASTLAPAFPLETGRDEFDIDFAPDELDVIDRLLVQANSKIESPPLAIADADDHERAHPYSAIWPHFAAGKRNSGNGKFRLKARGGNEVSIVPKIEVQYDEDDGLTAEEWIEAANGISSKFSNRMVYASRIPAFLCICSPTRQLERENHSLTNLAAPSPRPSSGRSRRTALRRVDCRSGRRIKHQQSF